MDPRTIICGTLAGIALVGSFVLAAIDANPVHVGAGFTAAGTFGGYTVGLYSSPHTPE